MWGLGEQPVVGKITKLKLQIGDWRPHTYSVMVASIGECISGMDGLRGAPLEMNGTYWASGTMWWLHARVITVGLIQQVAEIAIATSCLGQQPQQQFLQYGRMTDWGQHNILTEKRAQIKPSFHSKRQTAALCGMMVEWPDHGFNII